MSPNLPSLQTPSATSQVDRVDAKPTRRRAVVLGAGGRLGAAAVDAFAQAGWSVLAVLRRSPSAAAHPAVQPLVAGLDERATITAAARGAEVVLHAVNPPYTAWATEALPAVRQGLALAEQLGARFLLPGNVYNFGADMPRLLLPVTPQHPTSRKGRIRCDLEAEMQAAARRGVRSTVLRAGDFFGAGRGTWFDVAIFKHLSRGKLVYPGPLDQPHAWAYLPDLARAFVALAEAHADAMADGPTSRSARPGRPDFETLHFAGHTLTGGELLDAIEAAARDLGLQPARGFKRAGMPWGLIRLGGAVVPMWREIAEMAYLWQRPHALDGGALTARVGALPVTPIGVAMRQALLGLGLGGPEMSRQERGWSAQALTPTPSQGERGPGA